jgi:hypothetical protein
LIGIAIFDNRFRVLSSRDVRIATDDVLALQGFGIVGTRHRDNPARHASKESCCDHSEVNR